MPDSTNPTDPETKKRAKPGFIDQTLKDDLKLAHDCHLEAAKAEVATALAERDWKAAQQTELGTSLATADEFVRKIQEAREGTGTGSEGETAAHKALVTALDPILKGVRRTHLAGSAKRAAYGIGQGVAGASTQDLLRYANYAAGQLVPKNPGDTPADKLKGVLPAEITKLKDLTTEYANADWAHGQAQQNATTLLGQLRKFIRETLNPKRRDLQGAADQAYTHRNSANAPSAPPSACKAIARSRTNQCFASAE